MQVQGWFTNYSNEININSCFQCRHTSRMEINLPALKLQFHECQVSILIRRCHFYPNWNFFIYLRRWHWMYYRQLFKHKYLFVTVVLFNNFYLLEPLELTTVFQLRRVEAWISMNGDSPAFVGNLFPSLTTICEKCFPNICSLFDVKNVLYN